MRILHTTQYFLPRFGYQEFYLARAQLGAGHDVLVPIAPGSRRWLMAGYGCPVARVRDVIPLGADTDTFRPDAELRASLRAELRVSPAESVVLYTGKVARHKAIDVIIRAVASLSF